MLTSVALTGTIARVQRSFRACAFGPSEAQLITPVFLVSDNIRNVGVVVDDA